MFSAILGFLGIGATLLKAAIELLVPILKTILGWLLELLDFLVKRFIKEVRALFDVFPFMVLLLVFIGGGLYFHGSEAVLDKTVYKVTEKVTPSQKRRARRVYNSIPNPFKILGID
jgi:hypothetical protein